MFTILAAIVVNLEVVILALIAATPPTLVALAALYQAYNANKTAKETHLAVNSRMTELLEITKKSAGDAATLQEKASEKIRVAEQVIAEKIVPQKPTIKVEEAAAAETIVVDKIEAKQIVVEKKPTKEAL